MSLHRSVVAGETQVRVATANAIKISRPMRQNNRINLRKANPVKRPTRHVMLWRRLPRHRMAITMSRLRPKIMDQKRNHLDAVAVTDAVTGVVDRPSNHPNGTSPAMVLRTKLPRKTRTSKRSMTHRSAVAVNRSEEHTSELQSRFDLVCRLLLEKKK